MFVCVCVFQYWLVVLLFWENPAVRSLILDEEGTNTIRFFRLRVHGPPNLNSTPKIDNPEVPHEHRSTHKCTDTVNLLRLEVHGLHSLNSTENRVAHVQINRYSHILQAGDPWPPPKLNLTFQLGDPRTSAQIQSTCSCWGSMGPPA